MSQPVSDADELTLANAMTVARYSENQLTRMDGQADVLKLLREEASRLSDEAFRARALGQESVGKLKEETAKYLLSLVASLPTKLRGQ